MENTRAMPLTDSHVNSLTTMSSILTKMEVEEHDHNDGDLTFHDDDNDNDDYDDYDDDDDKTSFYELLRNSILLLNHGKYKANNNLPLKEISETSRMIAKLFRPQSLLEWQSSSTTAIPSLESIVEEKWSTIFVEISKHGKLFDTKKKLWLHVHFPLPHPITKMFVAHFTMKITKQDLANGTVNKIVENLSLPFGKVVSFDETHEKGTAQLKEKISDEIDQAVSSLLDYNNKNCGISKWELLIGKLKENDLENVYLHCTKTSPIMIGISYPIQHLSRDIINNFQQVNNSYLDQGKSPIDEFFAKVDGINNSNDDDSTIVGQVWSDFSHVMYLILEAYGLMLIYNVPFSYVTSGECWIILTLPKAKDENDLFFASNLHYRFVYEVCFSSIPKCRKQYQEFRNSRETISDKNQYLKNSPFVILLSLILEGLERSQKKDKSTLTPRLDVVKRSIKETTCTIM